MRRTFVGAAAVMIVAVMASNAMAHVTVQPSEAVAESFSSFVVRVPNERDDAGTTKIQVKFPPLASVRFQDVPGWDRSVKMQQLDEPIEAFGEELTEAVGTVTWSGGTVGPGEYIDFPFSAAMPAGEQELKFAAIQTYEGGEVVRWVGPEDADAPAPLLHTVELGDLGEGLGQLGTLHEVVHELEGIQEAQGGAGPEAAPADEEEEGEEEDDSDMGVILGAVGIAVGVLALLVALMKKRA